MTWEILPYVGMGPVKFGMTPEEVASLLGPPISVRTKNIRRNEQRQRNTPIVRFRNGHVSEIEAYYDVPNVTLNGVDIFKDNPVKVLQFLEERNGGCLEDVGILLFINLGVSMGRIDKDVKENHSICAFVKGMWVDAVPDMKKISFLTPKTSS